MTFTPADQSSAWAEGLANSLNSIVGLIENGFNVVGVSVDIGTFYVKDGVGYLPFATVGSLPPVSVVSGLIKAVTLLLFAITALSFTVGVVIPAAQDPNSPAAKLLGGAGSMITIVALAALGFVVVSEMGKRRK